MNLRLEQFYSAELMPFGSRSKAPVFVSVKHIEWIRRRACVITRQPGVDAHHVQFRSSGLNDYTAIPLQHEAHMLGHASGFDKLESLHGISLERALIATLVERVAYLEKLLSERNRDSSRTV